MIIGIGGVSNSGKSGLARLIGTLYDHKTISILCQDDFTKPNLPYIKDHIDWELPETMDFELLYKTILKEAEKESAL